MASASSIAEWAYIKVTRKHFARRLVNWLLLRATPKIIRIGAAELLLNPADPIISSAIALGVYETDEVHFFKKHIPGCRVFVDVGANIGFYSTLALHLLDSSATIIALEPHLPSFELLVQNIQRNRLLRPSAAPAVILLPEAATSQPGNYTLYLNPENGGDNRLYRGTFDGKPVNWRGVSVSGTRLDDVFDSHGLSKVDFVKLDVQGYEHQVVLGFQKVLAASPHVTLMTEFWPKGISESGGNPQEYLELLRGLGFAIYRLSSNLWGRVALKAVHSDAGLIQELPDRRYVNLVCVKSCPE